MIKTKPLIEQHFHGCFGVDFNRATVEEVLFVAREIAKYGIGGIFPTIVTDSVENTKRAIATIKEAKNMQAENSEGARILGVHLEGIFLNPEKKGIHNPDCFLAPTVENYKLVEDDIIKIITLAPEFCTPELFEYLTSRGVKIQAGHCTGGDLTGCTGVTHLFNAMTPVCHRGESTALSALLDDDIYTEIIADGIHVSDQAIKLAFQAKPSDKVILISDCLPCCQSKVKEFEFAGEKIYYDGVRATSADGTLAGSTTLLPFIIKRLAKIGLFNPKMIENPYSYHGIELDGEIVWDDEWNIIEVNL